MEIKKGIVIGIVFAMFLATIVINVPTNVSAESPVKHNDLELYFSFDDYTTSDTADDYSDNGLDGAITNAKYVSTTKFGRALRFDGNGDYVEIEDADDEPDDNLEFMEDLTIEAWVFWEGGDQIHTIAAHKGYFWFYIDGRSTSWMYQHLVFESGHGVQKPPLNDPWDPDVVSSSHISKNQWTHVAISRDYDSGTSTYSYKLYINGKDDTDPNHKTTYLPHDYGNTNTYIGSWSTTGHFFKGIIDEVKIFREVLTPSEGLGTCVLKMGFEENSGNSVYDRSGNNLEGTITGANWIDYSEVLNIQFDEGTGQVVEDSSIYENDGERGSTSVGDDNDPTWATGYSGNALDFDGTDDYVEIAHDDSLHINQDLTIEVWIYWHVNNNIQTIIAHKGYYWLYIDGRSGAQCQRLVFESGASPWLPDVVSASTIPSNQWVHIAVKRYSFGESSNGKIELYIDGDLDKTSYTYKPNDNGHTKTYIGAWNGASHYFYGKIDNLRIQSHFQKICDNNGCNLYSSRCLEFDGFNDYVEIQDDNSLDITTDLTIEAWIKPDTAGQYNYGRIISKFGTDNNNGWDFFLGNGYGKKLALKINGVNLWSEGGTLISSPPNWHHVAVTYESGVGAKFYIDGKSAGTHTATTSAISSNNFNVMIGKWPRSNERYFDGMIDDVRIYNYVKNIGDEVLRMPFEEGLGISVIDKTKNNNDGTLENGPWRITNGKFGNALSFDGNNDYVKIPDANSLDVSSDITIEAWIKPDSTILSTQSIVGKWDTGANQRSYYLFVASSNKLYGAISENGYFDSTHGGRSYSESENDVLVINEWNHVAMTFDSISGKVDLYINGIFASYNYLYEEASTIHTSNIPLTIGTNYNSFPTTQRHFAGDIDNVIISNYVKTFHEDVDGDGMSDMYEIIRSIESDQYNPIEYNGRYAVLMCWDDYDSSFTWPYFFWNQITYAFDMFKTYGYNDCDIFVLNENKPPTSNSRSEIVDYVLSESNIGDVMDILGDMSMNSDFIYIFGTDHGGHGDGEEPSTIPTSDDYSHSFIFLQSLYYWDTEFESDVNSINNYHTMVIQIEGCFTGGFIDNLANSNRIIMTTAFYCRIGSISNGPPIIRSLGYRHEIGNHVNADLNYYGTQNGIVSISEAYNYAYQCGGDLMYDDNGESFDQNDKIDCAHSYTIDDVLFTEPFYSGSLYWGDFQYEDKYGSGSLSGNHIDGPGMHLPTKDLITGDYLYEYTGNDYCGEGVSGWNEGRLGGKTYL